MHGQSVVAILPSTCGTSHHSSTRSARPNRADGADLSIRPRSPRFCTAYQPSNAAEATERPLVENETISSWLVFKRSRDATKENCPRSPQLPPFPSWPFDCLARAIGPGGVGTPTNRPEGPSVTDGNKWPPLWASGCPGSRKPVPMAQAMSMAGPLARNHMSRPGEMLHSVAYRS